MDKTGVVVNVERNNVIILTRDGEFAKVKLRSKEYIPEKGEEYTGREVKEIKLKFNKESILITLIVIVVTISLAVYGYLKPVGSVSVDGEISLVLKFNYFNKVTKIQSFDGESETFINSINVKNKDISTVMLKIYNKLKEEKMVVDKSDSNGITTYFRIDNKKDIELKEIIEVLQKDDKKVIITKGGISIYRN
ncbi:putative uncharacterized protein [Clostridium bornimense]|uniref:RsgI N-terminal anti-sigma domain-containing protein n=1 Tax=Clostridium bornimense TaxID=1216932 RepID=W6SD15_9CLOT|nr:hypothetical protein [Clostridium bornimense]CDM67500.1 putative uncharacterized protein [Clostridium bornimense]